MIKHAIQWPPIIFVAALSISACSDGDSGNSNTLSTAANTDTSPPAVNNVSPPNGSESASRALPITASFNEALFPVSVDINSVALRHDQDDVPSNVSLNSSSNMINIQPDSSLANLTDYTAVLTSNIRDLAGNSLDSSYVWSFTTEDGEWGSDAFIESDVGNTGTPQVALDNQGNAIAVWQQSNGLRTDILANRYSAQNGWATAELIESHDGNAQHPRIASDSDGNAIAVWQQDDGVHTNIWANHYDITNGWGTPILIESALGNAEHPQIAINRNGDALVVWSQSDLLRHNIWANRYSERDTWGTAVLIESNNEGAARSPQVAIDNDGQGVAAWVQWSNTQLSFNTWSNRFSPSNNWETPQRINREDGNGYTPQVAMGSDGNILAVWSQSDGLRTNIWANHYTNQDGWSIAEKIESDDGGNAGLPQLAINSSDKAIVVWSQSDGLRSNIWANHHNTEDGWSSAILIESDDNGNADSPDITIDNNGNGLAVWAQNDRSRSNIVTSRYLVESGWSPTMLIETNTNNGSGPKINSNNKGNAVAVWKQFDGTYNSIAANLFN